MRTNYHTHCDYCDGKVTAAAMAEAAAAAGYDALGFSSHAPLPFATDWTMPPERLDSYLAEVRRLRSLWGGAERRLEIYLGLEIDWIEGLRSPRDSLFVEAGLDYSIGSVHFVRLPGAGLSTVDSPPGAFAEDMARLEGEPETVWREYFRALASMIEDGGFDIVGHFDLVRKNNAGGRYFDEESEAYRRAALEPAALLKGRDLVVEINVGAMTRGALTSPYPSLEILRELRAMNVPITLSSDAHAPSHLGPNLEAARELARAAGYRSAVVLSRSSRGDAPLWMEIGIDET